MIYNLVLNSTNVIDSINKTQSAYTFINGNFIFLKIQNYVLVSV